MSAIYELNAELRTDLGIGASRRLRHADAVPAILYGAGEAPQAITLSHNQLSRALKHESFYSHILTIEIAGQKQRAVLKALQRHPYKPKLVHADFQRINESEKLHMHVPLHFIGEEIAPGVKTSGGIVTHLRNEVEITCLPADLPEFIEVDLSSLELGESIHLSQITLPKGVAFTDLLRGDDEHDHAVANIVAVRATVEDDSAPVAPAAPELVGKKAADAEAKDSKDKGKK